MSASEVVWQEGKSIGQERTLNSFQLVDQSHVYSYTSNSFARNVPHVNTRQTKGMRPVSTTDTDQYWPNTDQAVALPRDCTQVLGVKHLYDFHNQAPPPPPPPPTSCLWIVVIAVAFLSWTLRVTRYVHPHLYMYSIGWEDCMRDRFQLPRPCRQPHSDFGRSWTVICVHRTVSTPMSECHLCMVFSCCTLWQPLSCWRHCHGKATNKSCVHIKTLYHSWRNQSLTPTGGNLHLAEDTVTLKRQTNCVYTSKPNSLNKKELCSNTPLLFG